MVAIIGGQLGRFRPLVDLYREAGRQAVAATSREAGDDFFAGYAQAVASVAKERGWRPLTRGDFEARRGPQGAMLVGDVDEVLQKIVRLSAALGGISRITFQMNAASLPYVKMMKGIETIGTLVAPALRNGLGVAAD